MLLFAIVVISYIKTSVCVQSTPGKPVPHADILDGILTRNFGSSNIVDVIFGGANQTKGVNDTNNKLDVNILDMNINILDVDNIRKITKLATERYEKSQQKKYERNPKKNLRRWWWGVEEIDTLAEENFFFHTEVMLKAFHLVENSIYVTRARINDTLPFRYRFRKLHSYHIAVLCGASSVIFSKMEVYVSSMKNFEKMTHFIWYLILYEKILKCNTDLMNIFEKIHYIQQKYVEFRD